MKAKFKMGKFCKEINCGVQPNKGFYSIGRSRSAFCVWFGTLQRTSSRDVGNAATTERKSKLKPPFPLPQTRSNCVKKSGSDSEIRISIELRRPRLRYLVLAGLGFQIQFPTYTVSQFQVDVATI
ncbi:hypothetical protein VNO78_01831 [Psophocarpus tetragonolobus]|uniref:Uncharacterized protein n=1 Tax=Psophocarpus tetragonolobus TaxID=3891 RepID=A0AAN9XUU0_PSOTE